MSVARLDDLLDLYRDTLIVLDTFAATGCDYRMLSGELAHVGLVRRPPRVLALACVTAEPGDSGAGRASVMMRALTDFADLTGWRLEADPARLYAVGEEPLRFLHRFGFDPAGGRDPLFL